MKKRLRYVINRPPLGGWKWKEGDVTLEGDNLDNLIEQVMEYRESNGIPIGSIADEMAAHWATKSPWVVCEDEDGDAQTDEEMLVADTRAWLLELWKKPPQKLLTKKEAEPRCKVCAECPFNQKLDDDIDGAQDAERRALLLSRGIGLPKILGACSAHGWHNKVAVLLHTSKCDEWPES